MKRASGTEFENTLHGTRRVQLAAGELIGVRNARGAVLCVESGTTWITLEADTRDVVVEAGQCYRCEQGGTALVQVLADATVTIAVPAGVPAPELYRPQAAGPSRGAAWLRRLAAAWLGLHRWHPSQRGWDSQPRRRTLVS